MIRSTTVRLGLAAALVVSLPGVAAAQAEGSSPQGIEWHLAGYAVQGEIGIVPWHIDATLLLEDGTASGSTGCNRFSGSYTLEDENLVFDEALTMTRMACSEDQAAVESGFVTNLPQTATWAIEDGFLSLADAEGAPLLDFEETVVALTPSDVAALIVLFAGQQAQVDRLNERLDNVRIGTLRDRIKTLESEVKSLRAAAASAGSGSSLTAAERQLLKGVPANIRSTCSALRGGSLPAGTLAAVRCRPKSSLVGEMAYYLMPYDAARRTFNTVMRSHAVPERYRCHNGRASQMLQSPYHATGCFVDGGEANVRLVTWAAECRQLDIGGKRVTEPVTYIAIEGTAGRIEPLFEWATTADYALTPVWANIPAGSNPPSPGCEGLAF